MLTFDDSGRCKAGSLLRTRTLYPAPRSTAHRPRVAHGSWCGRLKDFDRRSRDLRPDPVARDDREPESISVDICS